MGGRAAGMNDTLRNTLVVKVGDLLPQDKIFQQRWAAATGAQRILIVSNAHAGWWSAENLPPCVAPPESSLLL